MDTRVRRPPDAAPTMLDTPWQVVTRHVRLWRRLLGLALVRELHYRGHVAAVLGVGCAQLVLAVVPVLVMFGYADTVRGWSGAQVVALVGLFQFVTGVLGAFVAPNAGRMTDMVRRGELDLVLVRPVSSQFYAGVRRMVPAELLNALTGLVVVALALARAGVRPGPLEIVQAGVLVGCGLVLLSCLWCALGYLAFWFGSVDPVSLVFRDLLRAGQYPLAFFPSAVRGFLTFAFPVAFATTFPVRALDGAVSWTLVGAAVAASAAALAALRAYWRIAVRGYTSASS